ncbi:hypothetical protein AGDE_14684 [Angomonas deanei]|uniref:Uncharacterized protein n=1 Tax=Angomonas deanei TaxID=59799 RepID=A0A7G2CFW6_9TRYP|nr:hypothetical protein AGDE_14684 [Angomonas deanei]CAD2217764.1 hypothetical protein, conserved [Angomonas deanei]|eukprot:EPY20421.1 hypothetical protein AGDE_14684 [Angomonas deanei]
MWFAPWGESVFAHNRDSISGGGGPTPLVSVAVTEEPPLLVAGMLVDPVTDRFLFQGAAFREEARVLAASVPRDTFETDLDKLNPQKRAVLRGLASRNRVMKLLVREYISLSEIHVNNLGGRFMVQTISLLSPQADAEADRKTLLSPQKVRELLPFVQSGCVSRVFSVPASGMTGGKREEEALDGGEAAEVPEEETAALPPFVGHRESTVYRDPMEEELALRQSNPRLLDNLLRRDPSNFVESGDKIRAACIFYSRNVLLKRAFRQLIEAATRIQEFLRACIAKKRRACERMLRAWRLLELESKFKLMHYKPPPSSVERIDMIANNVLQQHMTTTKEDKMRIIEDLWEERRKQYRAHMHKKRYNEWVGRKVNFSDPSLAVKDIIDRAQSLGGVDERELYDSGPTSRFRGNEGTFDEWNKRRSTAAPAKLTSTKATEKREMDYIHTHFGWYIPPELLLYESHRRLLKALKNSVLTTEHVQYEVERNRLKDPAAEINNASTSLPPVDQKAPPGKFSLAFLKHTDL